MYVTPAGSPDRYPSQAALIRSQLLETDTIFAESAQKNGGSSRQVRWVHDANCQPVIQRVTIPAIVGEDGKPRRVDGPIDDTVATLAAAGYKLDDWNRKYLLLVDYTATPSIWDSPYCGISTGLSNDDRPGLINWNNQGRTLGRIDPKCWAGVSDDHILPVSSVVAHELVHQLGAVHEDAPNGTPSYHCTDNGDLMCIGVPTGYDAGGYPTGYDAQMRSVCPAAQETLLDCNGDDYFSTNPTWTNGQYLSPASASPTAGRWNIANSSFLYTPATPTVTLRAGAGHNPGIGLPLTATVNVPSGQGWHLDYSIIQAIGRPATATSPAVLASCSLTRKTALSSDPAALSTSLLCNAATTSVSVRAAVTSEDGLTGVHILKLGVEESSLRLAATTLTASANPARVGAPLTLTATMTDQRSSQPIFGHPVRFLIRDEDGERQIGEALTDLTGTARVTVTADRSARYVAATDWTHTWLDTTAQLDVAAQTPTALTLPVAGSYVDAGSEVTLAGRLSADPDQALGLQPVELWRYADSQWTHAGTVLTDSVGRVEAKVTVTADASYQLRYPGSSRYTAAHSPQVTLQVRRATTTAAIDQTLIGAGGTITVSGTLSTAGGAVAGVPVELWRRTDNVWSKVSAATTSAAGKVTFPTSPASSGSYQLRFAATDRLHGSSTAELAFTVRRPLTVTATIPTSAPYGSPLTVTAAARSTDGPLPGRTLQLWALHSTGDTLVATAAATGADGTTRFTVPATGDRTYQVRVPADHLYEAAASTPTATVAVRSTAVTGTVTATEVRYGDNVTVAAAATSTSTGAQGPLAGATVELWATPTEGTSSRVASAVTSAGGVATLSARATETASYQLVFPGTADAARSTANLGLVQVRRATTATLMMPSRVSYDTATTVTGTLVYSGTTVGIAANPVDLWTAPGPGGAFTKVASAVTDSSGRAQFTVRPQASGLYQMRNGALHADGAYDTSASALSLTVVRATTTTVAAASNSSYGAKSMVVGTLAWAGGTSAVAGQPVELWSAVVGKTWAKVGSATTNSSGQASFSVTTSATADYQLRFEGRVVGAVTASSATSTNDRLTVLRATTATAKVSTPRLTYGAKVTVSGTLRWSGTSAGLSGQPVELWGYAAGRWTRLAAASSSSSGAVSFSTTPTSNTVYQVRYLGRVVGSVTSKASTSSSAMTKVVGKVYLRTPTKVSSRTYATLTGSIAPGTHGRSISVVVNGRILAKATTDRVGKFNVKLKYPKGRSSVYASLSGDSSLEGARSSTIKVTAS